MEKNIIILTKSKKINNLCIAGIDSKTGEWIRIISDEPAIQHAVRYEDIRYEDESYAEVLDKVTIQLAGYKPSYYQPENYAFDKNYYWVKTGKSSIQEVLNLHPIEYKDFLFFDNDKSVKAEVLKNISKNELHSLTLISPKNPKIFVKQFEHDKEKKVKICFEYSNNKYDFMTITDLEYENNYINRPDGFYDLVGRYLFVVSLGDVHTKDNKHYKIVAKVFKL